MKTTSTGYRRVLRVALIILSVISLAAFLVVSAATHPSYAQGNSAPAERVLAGKHIYLDPGHAGTVQPVSQTVTDGRGGMKPCQVSGTQSLDGWPEPTFNWLMALELKRQLEDLGAEVSLTRDDDTGYADCIDERARKENASDADLVFSIHADGNKEGNRGFHISPIKNPLPGNLPEESMALAVAIRDAMVQRGYDISNYLGKDGINPRDDLTGLNLSTKSKVLMEFGNMQDSVDIAQLQSPETRSHMAAGVIEGMEKYLEAQRPSGEQ